jgi:hypothetical protein
MIVRTDDINLTFPCEARLLGVVHDAVATAVRNAGRDATRAGAAASMVQTFLETCLEEAARSPITVRITDATVHVTVDSRVLDVPF